MLCVVSPLDVVDLTLAENGFQFFFEILTRDESESSDLDRTKFKKIG